MSIGFINNNPEAKTQEPRPESRTMLETDSGRRITFEDATQHLFVTGTTGCGKTAGVMVPCLDRMVAAGFPGLVVDIKGTASLQCRAIAAKYGREADIVEFGTEASAQKINLMADMDDHEIHDLFSIILKSSFDNLTHNMDFHARSIRLMCDVCECFRYLQKKNPEFDPNIVLAYQCLSNFGDAAAIWDYFKACGCDKNDRKMQLFINRVSSEPYNIFNYVPKGEKSKYKEESSTVVEQRAFITNQMTTALRAFLDTPGVESNFCASGAPALDMDAHFKKNSVIVLNFGINGGYAARILARYILSRYYQSIFKHGMELPEGRKAFVWIDEFQEIADFSDSRWSDTSFLAMARQFNGMFQGSAQSKAALQARNRNYASIDAFINNCNTKIIHFTDDPHTAELARRYDPRVSLTDLKPGQAFIISYDADTRVHAFSLDSFQKAFESTKEYCDIKRKENPVCKANIDDGKLGELANWCKSQMEGEKKPNPESEAPKVPGSFRRYPRHFLSETAAAKSEAEFGAQEDEDEPDGKCENPLAAQFPDFFARRVTVEIPVGWVSYVKKALNAFRATGLSLRISDIVYDDDDLYVHCESRRDASQRTAKNLLRSLLNNVNSRCVICGAKKNAATAQKKEEEEYNPDFGEYSGHKSEHDPSYSPLCKACQEKFQLETDDDAPCLKQ